MKKQSFLLSVLSILLLLSGCNGSNQTTGFFTTLHQSDGNYCFRELKKGMSLEEVALAEHTSAEQLKKLDSSNLFINQKEIVLDGIPFQRYYFFTYEKFNSDELKLVKAEYRSYFNEEQDFKAACSKLASSAKEELPSQPRVGSLEKLETVTNDCPQWGDYSQNNSMLYLYFYSTDVQRYISIGVDFSEQSN